MIKHVGLSIRDIQEVYDFYEKILGFKNTSNSHYFTNWQKIFLGSVNHRKYL